MRQIIRADPVLGLESLEQTWKQLQALQILVPAEVDSDYYVMARPVSRLIAYLFDEAHAATPEMIRGYMESLEVLGRGLARSIANDDILAVRLALEELQQTLQRIQSDLDETYRSVCSEVSDYKTRRRTVAMREQFRRIVYWMDRYVEPLVEFVRPDGLRTATFEEFERLLLRARDSSMFSDVPALDRCARQLRLIERQALRVFRQCRDELRPLYESLRRSSFIAAGAALALEHLQRDGIGGWAQKHVVPVYTTLNYSVPSDAAIARCVRALSDYRPERPPKVDLHRDEPVPTELVRQKWLTALPREVRKALPLSDLLAWVVLRYPSMSTADILEGFTRLVFHKDFSASFTHAERRTYAIGDSIIFANPVELRAP